VDYGRHTGPSRPYTDPKTVEAKIFSVLWELKKQGKAESTINFVRKALNFLSKHCNLDNPESVKGFIARLDGKEGYKKNLCFSYDLMLKPIICDGVSQSILFQRSCLGYP